MENDSRLWQLPSSDYAQLSIDLRSADVQSTMSNMELNGGKQDDGVCVWEK